MNGRRFSASTTVESVVSLALLTIVLVIVFPFFGQVLDRDRNVRLTRALAAIEEMQAGWNENPPQPGEEEETFEGFKLRVAVVPHKEDSRLLQVQTEVIDHRNKVIFTLQQLKFRE